MWGDWFDRAMGAIFIAMFSVLAAGLVAFVWFGVVLAYRAVFP